MAHHGQDGTCALQITYPFHDTPNERISVRYLRLLTVWVWMQFLCALSQHALSAITNFNSQNDVRRQIAMQSAMQVSVWTVTVDHHTPHAESAVATCAAFCEGDQLLQNLEAKPNLARWRGAVHELLITVDDAVAGQNEHNSRKAGMRITPDCVCVIAHRQKESKLERPAFHTINVCPPLPIGFVGVYELIATCNIRAMHASKCVVMTERGLCCR